MNGTNIYFSLLKCGNLTFSTILEYRGPTLWQRQSKLANTLLNSNQVTLWICWPCNLQDWPIIDFIFRDRLLISQVVHQPSSNCRAVIIRRPNAPIEGDIASLQLKKAEASDYIITKLRQSTTLSRKKYIRRPNRRAPITILKRHAHKGGLKVS